MELSQALDYFSDSYQHARKRFREAVQQTGGQLESFAIDADASEQDLTVDVGLLPGRGSDGDDRCLVLSSGLHGVEGFFGSAVQLQQLDHWRSQPPGLRVILLHALNPFGYAHIRRVDAQNRDLNRNFLIAGEPYAGCPPLYRRLDSLLNPRRSPRRWELFSAQALLALARFGFSEMQSAIAGGQYEYPQGLFFGGDEPSPLIRLLASRWQTWLHGCRRVVHLDLHTGLGKSAEWKLLLANPLSPSQRANLDRWHGTSAYYEAQGSKRVYHASGSWGRWCAEQAPDIDYLYACAEFGTYTPLRVLNALRIENQCHHWGVPDSVGTRRAKHNLLEAFCPGSSRWRHRVLEEAADLIQRTVGGCEPSKTS